MNAQNLLYAAIRKETNLDEIKLADEVVANYFDDKMDILGDILKYENDHATLGKIMIDRLKETIAEVVRSEESLEPDETPSQQRRDFDRNELR